jgi:UDPglucose--hexose-1-phosphate uridylyltransferase
VYYDDAGTTLPPERLPDRRSLATRSPTAVMRQDPLTGEWVSVAAARSDRIFLPPDDLDPLAPATPGNPSEVPSRYDVAVFENRSPAFGPDLLPLDEFALPADDIALGRSRPAIGRCEVVCFSPESQGSFALLPTSRIRTIIEAWADRTSVLSAWPGVEQVFPFENRGEQIGVTLHHPHGQIYAYPFVTPRTARLIASVGSYGPELFADILRNERAGERRGA